MTEDITCKSCLLIKNCDIEPDANCPCLQCLILSMCKDYCREWYTYYYNKIKRIYKECGKKDFDTSAKANTALTGALRNIDMVDKYLNMKK